MLQDDFSPNFTLLEMHVSICKVGFFAVLKSMVSPTYLEELLTSSTCDV